MSQATKDGHYIDEQDIKFVVLPLYWVKKDTSGLKEL